MIWYLQIHQHDWSACHDFLVMDGENGHVQVLPGSMFLKFKASFQIKSNGKYCTRLYLSSSVHDTHVTKDALKEQATKPTKHYYSTIDGGSVFTECFFL